MSTSTAAASRPFRTSMGLGVDPQHSGLCSAASQTAEASCLVRAFRRRRQPGWRQVRTSC